MTTGDRLPAHPTDAELDREFAYTGWEHACRDPHPSLVECRRHANHPVGDHAAGYGAGRVRWPGGDPRLPPPTMGP